MKNIEELEKECILHFSSWWGLSPTPGAKHILITKDKYYECTKYFKNKELNTK